jgi:hypothetical protein
MSMNAAGLRCGVDMTSPREGWWRDAVPRIEKAEWPGRRECRLADAEASDDLADW